MKQLISVIFAIALVGAGTVVGWEARNWHLVIVEWHEKAGAYDLVGPALMHQIMYELEKKRIQQQRYTTPEKINVDDTQEKLPSYPPMTRGQRPA
jgi:hypothetical protein